MSVSLTPAHFSSTVLYGRSVVIKGRCEHVLGYQNLAENLSGGPNAMILPLPAAAPMGPDNLLDVSSCRGLLERYRDALSSPTPRGFSGKTQVFESGNYSVVLAQSASLGDIEDALEGVPESRRPKVDPLLLSYYMSWYPGWHIALCCFDTAVRKYEPLVWRYEPMDPELVFLPGLEASNGKTPRIGVPVTIDHTLALGIDNEVDDERPRVRALLPAGMAEHLLPYFPEVVCGRAKMGGRLVNGDWYLPAAGDRMALARALIERLPPPGMR
ncbi:hypothetical protein G6O69_15980 [Pseudenhygromyxa sp. WMMC2535]|uniref:hypothetical protein n=1 Tax=Pseudenhygromyxa sp. WMMC2535 TaxID=2712867 RepID=UPI001555EF33|nr:hypothetical protein [Pseudenhygromyxa sp. WMMC2535]NVB39342.1 hypothetical protein [Pseudenhygromyxa sp. WMMC2535]